MFYKYTESARVNSGFYFGNSNLIRPSIFDDCAIFVGRFMRKVINIRVRAYIVPSRYAKRLKGDYIELMESIH